MIRPLLTRTVAETRAAIGESRVRVAHVAGLFLVGGGSRIPLAATSSTVRLIGSSVALTIPFVGLVATGWFFGRAVLRPAAMLAVTVRHGTAGSTVWRSRT